MGRKYLRNLQDLADALEVSTYQILKYSDEDYKSRRCYTSVTIKKHNGNHRILQIPQQKLKSIQKKLIPALSSGQICDSAFAYRKGLQLKAHGQQHLQQPLMVKMDIEAFFDTISFSQVFRAVDNAFRESPMVGPHEKSYLPGEKGADNYNSVLSWHATKICTKNGTLPQGAPTSPLLSNLIFFSIDQKIETYCKKRQITYTRYSDDLIFSGVFSPAPLLSFVRHLLKSHGFYVNEEKTAILGPGQQHKVTGIVVNEKVQAEKNYRREIRQQLYYICKHGIKEHLAWNNCEASQEAALRELGRILGKVGYVLQIDPENQEFQQYRWECIYLIHRLQRFGY